MTITRTAMGAVVAGVGSLSLLAPLAAALPLHEPGPAGGPGQQAQTCLTEDELADVRESLADLGLPTHCACKLMCPGMVELVLGAAPCG